MFKISYTTLSLVCSRSQEFSYPQNKNTFFVESVIASCKIQSLNFYRNKHVYSMEKAAGCFRLTNLPEFFRKFQNCHHRAMSPPSKKKIIIFSQKRHRNAEGKGICVVAVLLHSHLSLSLSLSVSPLVCLSCFCGLVGGFLGAYHRSVCPWRSGAIKIPEFSISKVGKPVVCGKKKTHAHECLVQQLVFTVRQ